MYLDKNNVLLKGLFRTICANPILNWYIIRFSNEVIVLLLNYPCQKPKMKMRFNIFYLYIDILFTALP